MLDGTVSNVFSAGYLGKTEQTTDASYPRLTGSAVAFKNRKAILFDVETKIKADGTFYTLFHTLDLAVIEQEANRLFQNTEYRKLFDGDRGIMEADFFKYLSNASKASTDTSKLDSAILLDKGDGLGAQRRDVLHQMGRMALQTGDAYKHQPIAVIPEGFRHSVTSFNIDGMTTPRVEGGARYDIDMKNAHKFIRENWQPDDMRLENTPNGKVFTHESKFKFTQDANGKVSAYTSAGAKIGTFGSIREAVNAGKNKYNSVYKNFDSEFKKFYETKTKETKNFEPLEEFERQKAISVGDLFELDSVKAFIGERLVLKHSRDEYIFQKANEIFAEGLSVEESDNAFANIVSSRKKEYETQINRTNELYRMYKKLVRERVDLKSSEVTKGLNDFYKSRNMREDGSDGVKLSPEDRQILFDLNEKYLSDIKEDRLKREQLQKDIYVVETEASKIKKQHENDGSYEFVKYFSEKWQDSLLLTFTEEIGLQKMMSVAFYNTKGRIYSGLLESLFAKEFDDQIQTGKPIVLLGTHGTTNARMMMQRAFSDSKLGERYGDSGALSATLGHFMGHSSETSDAYASRPRFGFGHPQGNDKMGVSDIIYKLDERIQSLERAHDPDKNKNYKPTLEQNDAFIKTLFKLREEKNTLLDLWEKASAEETKAHISLFEEATALYDYLYNATINKQKKITSEEFVLEASRILTILNYLNQNRVLLRQGEFINLNNALSKLAEVASGRGEGLEPSPIAFKESLNSFERYEPRVQIEFTSVEELSSGAEKRSGILKTNKIGDRSLPVNRKITGSSARDSAEMDMLRLFSSDTFINEAFGLVDKFKYSRESGMADMHDKFLGEFLEKTTILKNVNEKPYQDYVSKIKELHAKYDFKELMGNEYSRAYPDASPTAIDYTPMKVRALMAFDNPMVVVDPRSYEEHFISPHMIRAINAGHDGIIFKRFADGGSKDNIIISFKGNTKKIMEIDTSMDSKTVPRKDDNGNLIKQNFQPVDAGESSTPMKGIQLDLNKAYDVFRQEYEESTGQSWTQDKFMQRAKNWQFFGDENGFVAVRPQRSGFVKLVGMAGDNKSKLRGIQQIQQQGLPIWGMVSKDIKDIAVKRGMREPNMIERTLLKQALNSAALGDAEILGYTSDNGVRLRYPDIGEVTKYMIGSPEYYQKLRSAFGEQVKKKIGFQPSEGEQGGRVYDQNSPLWRSGFLGKYAEENQDRIKNKNIEFVKRKDGSYRITLTDNSGATKKIGHITADLDMSVKGEGVAEISSNIDKKFRGNKLANVLYSEMAERLRAMGVKYVDGTIVNKDGIPVQVRNTIIGQTYFKGSNKPASMQETARKVQAVQSVYPSKGIDVYNELDFNARYQPAEGEQGGRTYTPEQMNREFIGRYAAENKGITKGLKINHGIIIGRMGQEAVVLMKEGEMIGRLTWMTDKKNGNTYDLAVEIDPDQQGKKYQHLLYSEAYERMRAKGFSDTYQEIYNEQGIPIKSQIKILGKDAGTFTNRKFKQQKLTYDAFMRDMKYALKNGDESVSTEAKLDPKAWYQPDESNVDWSTQRAIKAREGQPRQLWTYPDTENFKKWAGKLKFIGNEEDASRGVNYDKGFVTTVYKGVAVRSFDKFSERAKVQDGDRPVTSDPNFFIADKTAAERYAGGGYFDVSRLNEDAQKAASRGQADMYYIKSNKPANLLNAHKLERGNPRLFEVVNRFWENNIKESGHDILDPRTKVNRFLLEIAMGSWLSPRSETTTLSPFGQPWRMDNWVKFHEHLLKNGYDSVVIFDNSVSKKAPTVVVPQETAKVKGSSNYGKFSKTDTRYNFQPDEGRKSRQVLEDNPILNEDRTGRFMPAEFTEFKSEQSPTGRILRNAKGYVIMLANNKFRVYNPSKAIIGVYGNEEEAKKRIYKEIPKR
jgi:ribosomal protein S18 acetylase RimI-like enzyme